MTAHPSRDDSAVVFEFGDDRLDDDERSLTG
jgi:hypothetical protein